MSCYMSLLPSPVLEAIAIREALSWSKNMGFDIVHLESNALIIVQFLYSSICDNIAFLFVIILSMIDVFFLN